MSGQTIERLPDAELEVMQAIWDCEPPVSRADIEPLLQRRHPMATTTLLTLLVIPVVYLIFDDITDRVKASIRRFNAYRRLKSHGRGA